MYHKLQYISQGATAEEQLRNIREALDGGCKWIQLRQKNANRDELLTLALEVKELCLDHGAVFIINDHLEIAKNAAADGVHLGLQDMPVAQARELVGDTMIIGGTANTYDDVVQRYNEGCNYVGLGPFRFTTTKEKLSPILGIEGYREIACRMTINYITIPVYAIGGIGEGDVEDIIATGLYGVAVSGLITNHPDKKLIIQQLNDSLYAKAYNS